MSIIYFHFPRFAKNTRLIQRKIFALSVQTVMRYYIIAFRHIASRMYGYS
jgi:hypothetical protein